MGNRLIVSIFVVGAILAFLPGISGAQSPQAAKAQATTPTPDLSGVWQIRNDPGGSKYSFAKGQAPLQPSAENKFKYNNMKPEADGKGRDELNPRGPFLCMPPGPTVLMLIDLPFEIIQTAGRVVMFYQHDHLTRNIWMDGRKIPKDPDPTWTGYSVGKWDGDTLVVDTAGINDKTWLDDAGTPHSDALHVVERYRRVSPDTLEVSFQFDDPKTFTKPWGGKKTYRLVPNGEISEHVICQELFKEKL